MSTSLFGWRIAAIPTLLALVAAAPAQRTTPPGPVAEKPASAWSVRNDPLDCRLVHVASGKTHLIALAPGAYRMLLAVGAPTDSLHYRWQLATISGPASAALGVTALVAQASPPTDGPIALGLTHAQFDALGDRSVDLAIDGHGTWSFPAVDRPSRVMLARCERGRLLAWGVSAAILDAVRTRPEFDGQPWFRSDDYPPTALSEDAQGSAIVLLRFSGEGKVEDCTLIRSTGHDSLDAVTCAVALRRGRARPARDSRDLPVPSVGLVTIVWRVES